MPHYINFLRFMFILNSAQAVLFSYLGLDFLCYSCQGWCDSRKSSACSAFGHFPCLASTPYNVPFFEKQRSLYNFQNDPPLVNLPEAYNKFETIPQTQISDQERIVTSNPRRLTEFYNSRISGENNSISSSGYVFEAVSPPYSLDVPANDIISSNNLGPHKNAETIGDETLDSSGNKKKIDVYFNDETRERRTAESVRSARNSQGKHPLADMKSELTSKTFLKKAKKNKCNNLRLKQLMEMKMTGAASTTKQMLFSATKEIYVNGNVNIFCSKHKFSYIIVTSPVFCEHRKNLLTCLVFVQP